MALGNTATAQNKELSSAQPGGPTPTGYLPFLDGLRAISILLVLGFHKLGPLTGFVGKQLNGWVGVELFFVISGYLISSILLKEQDRKGNFNLKNFYVRRWLRLCPAYYVFLLFMMGFMVFRGEYDFGAFAVAGLYLTNIDMCAASGMVPATTGLLHSWSLCVEEQFYLLWPGAMKLSGKKALPICLALICAVYAWRLYLLSTGASWIRLSVGLDTKFDSIMLGVAIALLWRNPSWKSKVENLMKAPFAQATIVGLLLVACHFLGHPATEAQPFLFWALKLPLVLVLMSTLLVSLLANQSCATARLLSTKPLVWIGRLSYSLYLWHVVVNFPCTDAVFQALSHHKYVVEILKYTACFGLAAGSYYLIEQPFLKLKRKFS